MEQERRRIDVASTQLYDKQVPKVLEINGFRFFFYSNEGQPLEPAHVHVRKNESVAKFALKPEIRLVSSWGFKPKELNWLEGATSEHRARLLEAWNEYFG